MNIEIKEIENTLKELILKLYGQHRTREISIAITKVEEALMWFEKNMKVNIQDNNE